MLGNFRESLFYILSLKFPSNISCLIKTIKFSFRSFFQPTIALFLFVWLPCIDLAPKVKEVLALLTQSMLGKSVDYTPCGFCVGHFFSKKRKQGKSQEKRKSNSPLCTHTFTPLPRKHGWWPLLHVWQSTTYWPIKESCNII